MQLQIWRSMVDKAVEILKAKKLLEMQKRFLKEQERQLAQKDAQAHKVTPREIFRAALYDRGEEVLMTAEQTFPEQTRAIVERLAELIDRGQLKEKISGGQLLALFRRLGLRVSMNTKIVIEEKGKMVSLAEKLKSN
ncbi:MAG: double-stranded DNA-binding protein [Thaumarchaeota archaeon]|nr:double-stranded DNA-binding protein [Nitrososphaerota archaeon]